MPENNVSLGRGAMSVSSPNLVLQQAYFSYRRDDTEAASARISRQERHSDRQAVDPPPQSRLELSRDLKRSLGHLADQLGRRRDVNSTDRAEDRVLVCREVQQACGENSVRLSILRTDVSAHFEPIWSRGLKGLPA